MLRKINLLILCFAISVATCIAQEAKYIFYFIGDGMGLSHVKLTEMYQAELKGHIGIEPLVFTQFPFSSVVRTYSLSNAITDSAAGGTALAVGKKTKNGIISMNEEGTVAYKSIAHAAKEKGMKVGIATSVSIDHATPSVFYASQNSRKKYYEIAASIPSSNFDFFAGAGFLSPNTDYNKNQATAVPTILTNAGYTIVEGYDAFEALKSKAGKIVLTNNPNGSEKAIEFEIDRTNSDMSLAQITSAAIESLSTDNSNGFFLMIEGGKIDWCSHSNDAGSVIKEVQSFNDAVKKAYEFYEKHPNETLIVITADHETGGLSLGNGSSRLKTKYFQYQKVSQGKLSNMITALRKDKPNTSWEELKQLLSENVGLWSKVKVSDKDEAKLKEAFTASFANHKVETKKTLYANDDKIATLAISILNDEANIAWGSSSHSGTVVPVYAIGVGAQNFCKELENTDVPKIIAKSANLTF